MEVIALLIMSALLPMFTISAFIIGYNMNAEKRIRKPRLFRTAKKAEPTEDELMLERIDKAKV